jgi:hypothetical protein
MPENISYLISGNGIASAADYSFYGIMELLTNVLHIIKSLQKASNNCR